MAKEKSKQAARKKAGKKSARKSQAARKRNPWPHVAGLVTDDGATIDINGGGYGLDIAAMHNGSSQVCIFHCGGMTFEAIMNHLESLATRYVEEGIVTDEVNGQEWSVE